MCAAPAVLFASGSWLGPVAALVTGSLLLLLCARTDGDLPFAAVGIGATGALAMTLATIALTGGVPVTLLVGLAIAAGLGAIVTRALTSTSSARAVELGAGPARVAWLAIALLAILSFPARDRIERAVIELVQAESRSATLGEGPVPTALSRAPSREVASVSETTPIEVDRSAPHLRTTHRTVTVAPHRMGIWLVGLFLAGAGSLALFATLARLRLLRGARHARRTPHGYVLDDGEPIELEPPSRAPRVVVRSDRALGYRALAVQRAQLLGEGEIARLVDLLRRRAQVIALGTLVAAATAWIPLV